MRNVASNRGTALGTAVAEGLFGLLLEMGDAVGAPPPPPPPPPSGSELLYALAETDPTPSSGGSGTLGLYVIDQVSGAATFIAPTSVDRLRGLAIDPITGVLYASERTGYRGGGSSGPGGLYTIDPTTGTATLVGSTGVTLGLQSLDFSPGGVLYGVSGSDTLYTVDTTTGLATALHTFYGDKGIAVQTGGTSMLGHNYRPMYSLTLGAGTQTTLANISGTVLDPMEDIEHAPTASRSHPGSRTSSTPTSARSTR